MPALPIILILCAFIVFLVIKHLYFWQPLPASKFYPEKPLFMGHRGVMTRAPENTFAAYGKALQAGLKGTELDVIETKDGHLVCSHNFDLERVTDGEGYLFERELPYLTRINAAHHFIGHPFENIPLLEDVLSFFPTDFRINIEVKPRSLGDLFTTIKVSRIVSRRNLQNRVIISSFNPLALLGVKLVDESILTGFLVEPDTWPLFRLINVGHPDCLHLDAGLVSDDLLRYARQRGMVVNVWTVDNKPAIDWLVRKGVDGIITDRPEYCDLR